MNIENKSCYTYSNGTPKTHSASAMQQMQEAFSKQSFRPLMPSVPTKEATATATYAKPKAKTPTPAKTTTTTETAKSTTTANDASVRGRSQSRIEQREDSESDIEIVSAIETRQIDNECNPEIGYERNRSGWYSWSTGGAFKH